MHSTVWQHLKIGWTAPPQIIKDNNAGGWASAANGNWARARFKVQALMGIRSSGLEHVMLPLGLPKALAA